MKCHPGTSLTAVILSWLSMVSINTTVWIRVEKLVCRTSTHFSGVSGAFLVDILYCEEHFVTFTLLDVTRRGSMIHRIKTWRMKRNEIEMNEANKTSSEDVIIVSSVLQKCNKKNLIVIISNMGSRSDG